MRLRSPSTHLMRDMLLRTGGKSMSLNEVNTVATTINPFFDGDAMIIFGATIDEDLDDNELVVTVVATDFASEGI